MISQGENFAENSSWLRTVAKFSEVKCGGLGLSKLEEHLCMSVSCAVIMPLIVIVAVAVLQIHLEERLLDQA